MTGRPALVVSVARLGSGRAVWSHRAIFDAVPEVHVVDLRGRFLTADEARVEVPELTPEFVGGLDYEGTFFDALDQKRLTVVLPLVAPTGAVQGLLEFVGVPYAGCGMTGAILAHDPRRARAILASQGLVQAPPGTFSTATAVLGNEDPVVGGTDPEVQEFCRRVYQGLGLSGWALIGTVPAGDGRQWTTVEAQPDLGPADPFLRSLQTLGLGLDDVLARILKGGRDRHDAESGLKSLFKDKI